MKKLSEYKDFKTLIFLFSIEAVLLIVMLVIAHFSSVKTVEPCTDYDQIILSMTTVKNNILNKTFDGNGVSAMSSLNEDIISGEVHGKRLCKFYTFNLSDEGITSNLLKAEENAQMNGIAQNTATTTIIPAADSEYKLGRFKVRNDYVPVNLDLEEILSKPLRIEPMKNSNILIYHVHASEGYCVTESDKYNLNSYTIVGENNNVVGAGNVLQNSIISHSGIKVLHDKTVFKEGLESIISYNNAAVKLDEIYASNDNIKLQIDLHRNSAEINNQKYGPTVELNGKKFAPISFVIGLDWNPATGQRQDETNPYWEDNFKLCMLVIEKLEKKVPGICRQIDLRRNPYNQNYAENSLLIEVGFAGNLSTEADATAEILGEVLSDIYG